MIIHGSLQLGSTRDKVDLTLTRPTTDPCFKLHPHDFRDQCWQWHCRAASGLTDCAMACWLEECRLHKVSLRIQLKLESQVRRMRAFEQAKIKGLTMAIEMTTYFLDG
jgi:hypothetical protein